MLSLLQLLSILLEAAVALLGLMLVVRKKKIYGWGIALTFLLYIFYDLASLMPLSIPRSSLDLLFLAATISILWAIWTIFLDA